MAPQDDRYCSSSGAVTPPSPPPSSGQPNGPAVHLLDLPDDVLVLVAARLWAPGGGGGGGFVAASHRTRRLGLAALRTLTLRWCTACCNQPGTSTPGPDKSVSPVHPHPPALDARLPSLTAFLAVATCIRVLTIVDAPALPRSNGNGDASPPPPCRRGDDEREEVWRAVGAALGGRPLDKVTGDGAVASVLAGREAVGGTRLRVLHLNGVGHRAVPMMAVALRGVAPTVAHLTLHALPDTPDLLAGLFRSAGCLPALTHLFLTVERRSRPIALFGRDEAAAIASACPGLTNVEVQCSPRTGWGASWAVSRGALPQLTTFRFVFLGRGNQPGAADFAALLARRQMVKVRLCSSRGSATPIVAAVRSVDRLPKVLHLGMPMEVSDAVQLLDDSTATTDIKSLSLHLRGYPNLLLLCAARLPRLHTLWLRCLNRGGDVPVVSDAARWAVPPTLRSLLVEMRHEVTSADVAAADLALVRWIVASVGTSRVARHLTELRLCARVPPGPELEAALAPLVTASANQLRTVILGVKPISDDGVGKRRRMEAALSSALPRAKVQVKPSHSF